MKQFVLEELKRLGVNVISVETPVTVLETPSVPQGVALNMSSYMADTVEEVVQTLSACSVVFLYQVFEENGKVKFRCAPCVTKK
ncbi:hypothetical protein FDI76_gp192 [Serratia phage vB_Sru_IME250]|uniref:Uncharacterized protein n=1 Tax=Serratia phage vB_Sru_IME250 TaxID=1852640 RepID=A0A1J0MG17_9CAUD|nr:hypothetical protein FDI76_gp192 [Serratia phage vB_Sru_IME250]ANM47203.1 hypothetical protein [Serratia phage vB_Sru_IME250]APD20111.1 hypothetical protein [Serratia phage vB_Sru_IME250]